MRSKLMLITLILFSYSRQTMSQSETQRLVLAEDFSSIYCPPSAPANIYLNSLLNINTSKVVKLTYQWHLLSTYDPMYLQNSQQLDVRSYYYGLNSIPYSRMDGSITLHPYNWTKAKIDSAYAVPSSFHIALSHSFNLAHDSIFINATIKCMQHINMTTPKFRCAMTEDVIHFTSPPGNNGEKDFYDIMRRMYPDANGTSLSTSWMTGQTQTITFAEKIPTYIYDISQIAVVAFIQDDLTKHVEQAAYSSPLLFAGVNEEMNENSFNFFPNPATDYLTIGFKSNIIKTYVSITDISGKIIFKTAVTETLKIEVNVKEFTSGIYIVQIQNNEFVETKKLIITK